MSKTIITVDDSVTMRKLVSLTLRGAGYRVLEAGDGVDALQILRTQPVDLMILDVNMPRMNGIQLTKEVRNMSQFRSTPILMLTTESDNSVKTQGKQAGANGWIVKPFKQDQILAVVSTVFQRMGVSA